MGRLSRICCVVAGLLLANDALAHATLTRSTPGAGSTLAAPPTEVVLEFNEQVEPSFSAVQVLDGSGTQVSQGTAALVPGRKDTLRVKVGALRSGSYKVNWKAVSLDTHVTRGSFMFRVEP